MRRHLARLVVVSVLLAVGLGVAWFVIAPTPQYLVTEDGLIYASDQPGEFWEMDGWFGVLAAIVGVVAGVTALRGAAMRVVTVVVLAVTGVLGSLLAWWIGHLLGPEQPSFDPNAVVGSVVEGQLTIAAKGVLTIWPLVALGVVVFALAWTRPPDGEAEEPGQPLPAGDEPVSVRRDGDLGELDTR